MITGNRGLFHLLALARIYTKINNVALLLPSLVVVWVQINWLLYVSPYMPRGRLPQRNHKGDGFLFLSFIIPTKSCVPPKIATSECYFGLTLVPADKACLPQPKNVQIPATLPTVSACAICLQNLHSGAHLVNCHGECDLSRFKYCLSRQKLSGNPSLPHHRPQPLLQKHLWYDSFHVHPSYALDMMIWMLSSHSEGFLSDAAKLQRKLWKSRRRGGFVLFLHGKYGPLGYFWAFPCGYPLKPKA